jgi:hypothetical protein
VTTPAQLALYEAMNATAGIQLQLNQNQVRINDLLWQRLLVAESVIVELAKRVEDLERNQVSSAFPA